MNTSHLAANPLLAYIESLNLFAVPLGWPDTLYVVYNEDSTVEVVPEGERSAIAAYVSREDAERGHPERVILEMDFLCARRFAEVKLGIQGLALIGYSQFYWVG